MKKSTLIPFIIFSFLLTTHALAQFGEPEVKEKDSPRTLLGEGYNTGFGFNFSLNDFGFSAGGQFRLGMTDYSEAILDVRVGSLKDPSEQTFIDYTFGFRTVPEKYRRVIALPMYIGVKKRFFAAEISDNFRLFSALSAGPVVAWSFPYFNDSNENGFRENDARVYGFAEQVYDIFQGWNNSETHWGLGGEFMVGVDFGDNFANLNTVQFGYTMNYFSDGIQVLEPFRADLENARIGSSGFLEYDVIPSHDPRKYFGSAQISFVFGWMW